MSFWPLHIHLVLFMMLSLAFTGCATIRVEVIPRSVKGIEAGDCLTVVLDFQDGSPQKAEELEKSIGDCISDAMIWRNLSAKFINPGEFRRAVFPDMDITSVPRGGDRILGLLGSSQFRNKIQSLNLRYLITVREHTWSHTTMELDHHWGGYWIHRKNTELVAYIVDLQKASDSGEVRVTVAGRGYYGYCILLPVIPAYTEGRACQILGRAVTKLLLGGKTGELSK